MTVLETDLLADLIRQKLDCLMRLRDVGKKQLELVGAGRITELLDVLSAKQHVLMDLKRIEAELDPFRGEDPDRRQWRSPEQRQRSAEELRTCETLLGEIVTREKEGEQELIRRRDEAAAQLRGAHLASEARGAYLEQARPGPFQIDLSSES